MTVSLLAVVIALGGAGYAATGGTFILGDANNATTMTTLTANGPGYGLDVQNKTGPAAIFFAKTGKPPFAINSAVRVKNLNADYLDGLDSSAFASVKSLGRVGGAFDITTYSGAAMIDKASVSLTIPRAGYVLLNAQGYAVGGGVGCSPCTLHAQLRDVAHATVSPVILATIGNGTGAYFYVPVNLTWVVPVSPGVRTFKLQAAAIMAALSFWITRASLRSTCRLARPAPLRQSPLRSPPRPRR